MLRMHFILLFQTMRNGGRSRGIDVKKAVFRHVHRTLPSIRIYLFFYIKLR